LSPAAGACVLAPTPPLFTALERRTARGAPGCAGRRRAAAAAVAACPAAAACRAAAERRAAAAWVGRLRLHAGLPGLRLSRAGLRGLSRLSG